MTLQILPLRVRSFLSWACDFFWLIGCNESDVAAVLSPGHKGLALFCAFVLRNLSPPYAWAWEPAWGDSVCMSAQSCLTLCDPMDCSPPTSSAHGILQARILEWVATKHNLNHVPCINSGNPSEIGVILIVISVSYKMNEEGSVICQVCTERMKQSRALTWKSLVPEPTLSTLSSLQMRTSEKGRRSWLYTQDH